MASREATPIDVESIISKVGALRGVCKAKTHVLQKTHPAVGMATLQNTKPGFMLEKGIGYLTMQSHDPMIEPMI